MIRDLFNRKVIIISLNEGIEIKYKHKRLMVGFGIHPDLKTRTEQPNSWRSKKVSMCRSQLRVAARFFPIMHCHSPSPLPNQALLLLRYSTTLRQMSFSSITSGFFFSYRMSSAVSGLREIITSYNFFCEFKSHIVVSDFEWREVSVWVLDLLFFFFVLHQLVIFFYIIFFILNFLKFNKLK